MVAYRSKIDYFIKAVGVGLLTGVAFAFFISVVKVLFASPYLYFTEGTHPFLANLAIYGIFCGLSGIVFGLIFVAARLIYKKKVSTGRLISIYLTLFFSFAAAYAVDWWLSNIFFGYRHYLFHWVADFLLVVYAVLFFLIFFMLLKIISKSNRPIRIITISIILVLFPSGEWLASGYVQRGFSFKKAFSEFARGEDLNVILIIVDSLLPAKLGAYGQLKRLSPNVDVLAGEGTVFLNAITQTNWTHALVPSLFTSTYPSVHGVVDENKGLPESMTTIAEVLQANGYATCAFMTDPWVSKQFNLDQGFDFYVNLIERDASRWYDLYYKLGTHSDLLKTPPSCYPTADLLTAEAINWIDKFKDKNFFLYLHYMDVHGPHIRHDLSNTDFVYADEVGSAHPSKTEVSMYEVQVWYTDYHIGLLMEKLRKLGIEDKTLIIVSADNGRSLDELDEIKPGEFLYEDDIKIPLVMRLPGVFPSGLKLQEQVQGIDIMPTILSVLDLEPEDIMQGMDMQGILSQEPQKASPRPAFSELGPTFMLPDSHLVSVRIPPWKYIYNLWSKKRELYNIDIDSQEQNNLIGKEPKATEMCHGLIVNYIFENMILSEKMGSKSKEGSTESVKIDETTKRQLQGLGYLQ